MKLEREREREIDKVPNNSREDCHNPQDREKSHRVFVAVCLSKILWLHKNAQDTTDSLFVRWFSTSLNFKKK